MFDCNSHAEYHMFKWVSRNSPSEAWGILDVEFTCSTWIAEPKKPPLFFQEGEIHEVHEHFSCELIQLEMILGWLKAGRDTRFTKGLSNVTLGNPISFSRKKIDDDQKRDLTY